ncbi:hypothetical protein LIER_03698 [Lithospermum erythrorhizon]|uniref:Bacterial surface antigen (D15) domain-containing protein n=1 Tax=Lithospermum erythrorhizon TaxID=34254 RepID=A0AAV3NU27_LITER
MTARVSLLSQDWLKFSSYKEQALGLSLGLLSSENHDLSYSLSWRTLSDPSQMSSRTVRRQLGHSLVSAGIVLPWGNGSSNMVSYLPERFFLGGNSSPICSVGGPTSVLGFKTRGLGPAEPRRTIREISQSESSDTTHEMDYVGGDLAVTAFADLSFDLPLKVLRDSGIHGHAFACTGSLNKLTENAYRDLSFQKFRESFRSSTGIGIILPTKLFRMEVNYCYILKQQEHDRGKTGLQFSFSPPW